MEANLYPNSLEGLGLTFVETIFAIAFGLEDALHAECKTEVFAELGLTPEQMKENVEKTLKELCYTESYALCRVLGDMDASRDSEVFKLWTLERCFNDALKRLRGVGGSDLFWRAIRPKKKLRYTLLGGRSLWSTTEVPAEIGRAHV